MIASAIDGRKAEREDNLLIDESTKALSSGRLALNNNLPKSFSRSLPLHPCSSYAVSDITTAFWSK